MLGVGQGEGDREGAAEAETGVGCEATTHGGDGATARHGACEGAALSLARLEALGSDEESWAGPRRMLNMMSFISAFVACTECDRRQSPSWEGDDCGGDGDDSVEAAMMDSGVRAWGQGGSLW